MSNTCPHLARGLTFPESEIQETRHIVNGVRGGTDNIVGYTRIEREYIEYAKLIQDFVKNNSAWLQVILDNCYEPGISKREYLHNAYIVISGKLHSIMDEYGDQRYRTILSGVGTLIIILISISELMPTLQQEECMRHCEIIMKKIDINELPINPKRVFGEYRVFITKYFNGEIELTKGGKLYCPIEYTPEGNTFFKLIVSNMYKYFPVEQSSI